MGDNDRVVRELVRFVREQRTTNRELMDMHKGQEKRMGAMEILLRDHDKWMKDHEVSLRLHYKLIAALGEKLH